MGLANGVHHLAICTGDVKAQIEFFTDVLGAELKALYWMHGVDNTFHGFLKLNDPSYVAFVQNARIADIEPQLGCQPRRQPRLSPSAPGTMQHVAFNVDSARRAAGAARPHPRPRHQRDRPARPRHVQVDLLRRAGGPQPRDLHQRAAASTSGRGSTPRWPRSPASPPTTSPATPGPPTTRATGAPCPSRRSTRPSRTCGIPTEVYERLMTMPDDVLTARLSQPDPPVAVSETTSS